jgi:hypothetical protein
MMAHSRALTFGLGDADHPAHGSRQPLIDVVFVPRLQDGFTVAGNKGKNFDSLLHGCSSAKVAAEDR